MGLWIEYGHLPFSILTFAGFSRRISFSWSENVTNSWSCTKKYKIDAQYSLFNLRCKDVGCHCHLSTDNLLCANADRLLEHNNGILPDLAKVCDHHLLRRVFGFFLIPVVNVKYASIQLLVAKSIYLCVLQSPWPVGLYKVDLEIEICCWRYLLNLIYLSL